MKIAERARQKRYWHCEWVSLRWKEIKNIEWYIRINNYPWMTFVDKVDFEQACDDIQIGLGQIPSYHKNILLGD